MEAVQELVGPSSLLVEKFATAVKNGKKFSGESVMEAVGEFAEPSSIFADKIAAAVKKGARHASEQMMEAGVAFVQSLKESKTNKV
ncbi:hypothetical protein VN24_03480 [Paenibacillus beijingensis]|uniref:Uncharacterized protein n=2 Tax=Paenibacillus beijingensis TaxID=1126833 RepID=A0A0D5NRE5_9BACL|nr:hypothetical protein VN24_03480 [Paenibacillus beijingensis]